MRLRPVSSLALLVLLCLVTSGAEAQEEDAAEEAAVAEDAAAAEEAAAAAEEAAAEELFEEPLPLEREDLRAVERHGWLESVVGIGRLVTLEGRIERIALGDEALARVQLISAREVLLTGLRPGRTTFFVWHADGRRLRYELRVEPDLDELERDLDLARQAVAEDLDAYLDALFDSHLVTYLDAGRDPEALEELARDLGERPLDRLLPRVPRGDLRQLQQELDASPEAVRRRFRERFGVTLEAAGDGEAAILRGRVPDAKVARAARQRAESLVPLPVVDMLRHRDPDFSPDDRLVAELKKIDRRIEVRRIQVGPEPEQGRDTYVLEGKVATVAKLVQALTLAERQLGGSATGVVPVEDQAFAFGRNRSFGLGQGLDSQTGLGTQGGLGGGGLRRAPPGLASQISRGLAMMSASGRVLSFLEVEALPQILVAIRVLEIDRTKARRLGINFRIDSEHWSIGSFTGPQASSLPGGLQGPQPSIDGIAGGNLAVAFVDQLTSITAAIDFLEDKQLARAVAEPNIVTLAGEQASVVVGGEVPIPTTAVGNVTTVQGFQFQEFGVRLDIRPAIDEQGVITLEVSPSIIRPEGGLTVGGVPGFSIQSVQTTARVYAGQSLVIGGLMDFQESLDERRLPILGKLPIFRWRGRNRSQLELLFVISPRLVEIEPPEVPDVPIDPPQPERLELPPLDWSEDRDDWRDEFEPQALAPEGVPPEFLRRFYEPLRRLEDEVDPVVSPAAPLVELPVDEPVWEEPEEPAPAEPTSIAGSIVAGARLSLERAPEYDASYAEIPYPGGDPGWHRGTGADLVVRAFRHAGIDLQERIHEDVVEAPAAYGVEEPDPNVDHRRLRNLAVFFARNASSLPAAADWLPGDVVVWDLGGGRLHIGIVSDRRSPQGHPLAIHHLRPGRPSEEDALARSPVAGHYRWPSGGAQRPPTDESEPAALAPESWVIRETADPCLFLRPEADFGPPPEDCLPPGTRVLVLDRAGDWSRVVLPDGREGFMATVYLAPEGGVQVEDAEN